MGHESKSRTFKATITHEDLTETTANTAQVIDVLDLNDGDIIKAVWVNNKTAFEDDSDEAFNATGLTIGDDDDADRFLASSQLNANGTEIGRAVGIGAPFIYGADKTLKATFGSMTAKSLSDIDTGELEIFVELEQTAGY